MSLGSSPSSSGRDIAVISPETASGSRDFLNQTCSSLPNRPSGHRVRIPSQIVGRTSTLSTFNPPTLIKNCSGTSEFWALKRQSSFGIRAAYGHGVTDRRDVVLVFRTMSPYHATHARCSDEKPRANLLSVQKKQPRSLSVRGFPVSHQARSRTT